MKTKILLILIIVLFLITRLYKISEIPASLYWDEASIGYNALSVLKTGRDEWGDLLPLHFRAFGEFKLPVYIYSVALSEYFFGINEFAVRLPSVLYSLGIIVLVFLISKKVFNSDLFALLSAFFVSISPWVFIFSRTGYEAIAGLFFYLLAVYISLVSFKKKFWFVGVVICSILAIYSYNSYRIIVPLSLAVYLFFYLKNSHNKKTILFILTGGIMFLVSLIPIYNLYINDYGASRYSAVSILSPDKSILEIFKVFIQNYFSHFGLSFLLEGDKNLRSQQSGFGQIYFIDLFFTFIGLFYIIKDRLKIFLLPVFIILISFIPAAITNESPHALRTLTAVPFIMMIVSIGVYKFSRFSKKYQQIVVCLIVTMYLVSFGNYFYNFLVKYPNESSTAWQYPYKYLFKDSNIDLSKYERVYVTDRYAQPYIYKLFYTQELNSNLKLNSINDWGVSKVSSDGNTYFQQITPQIIDDNNERPYYKVAKSSPANNILIFSSSEDKLNIPAKKIIRNALNEPILYEYEIR